MGAVNGPGSSVVGNVVLWDNTTGTLVSDSGETLSIGGLSDGYTDSTNLVLGSKPTFSTGINNTVIGEGASTGADKANNVVIGWDATANSGNWNVAIGGGGATCSAGSGVAVGYGSTAASQGVSIGYGANCGTGSINIGYGINATHSNAIGIGGSPSGDNVAQIGNGSVTVFKSADLVIDSTNGATIGSPTGGQMGAGTLNTQGLYINGISSASRFSCRVATTAALTATYSNGTSGVGATLTNSGTKAAISIDGVALSVNDRVLVKDQASALQNGIYTVTTVGSGTVNWVLTRAVDFNAASNIGVVEGAFTVIEEGTSNSVSLWVETGAGPFTIGTTAITFSPLGGTSSTPTRQYLKTGTSATYTTPANCKAILVKAVGGGGGGGAQATNNGSDGSDTIFNSIHAKGGKGGGKGGAGVHTPGGAGGSAGTGTANLRIDGGGGNSNQAGNVGLGGSSAFGGAGKGVDLNTAGDDGATNSGGGGSGAGQSASGNGGCGGGAGEYFELYISSPAATYTYTIGAGGNGGAAGTVAGGNGGSGLIIVEEYY